MACLYCNVQFEGWFAGRTLFGHCCPAPGERGFSMADASGPSGSHPGADGHFDERKHLGERQEEWWWEERRPAESRGLLHISQMRAREFPLVPLITFPDQILTEDNIFKNCLGRFLHPFGQTGSQNEFCCTHVNKPAANFPVEK